MTTVAESTLLKWHKIFHFPWIIQFVLTIYLITAVLVSDESLCLMMGIALVLDGIFWKKNVGYYSKIYYLGEGAFCDCFGVKQDFNSQVQVWSSRFVTCDRSIDIGLVVYHPCMVDDWY